MYRLKEIGFILVVIVLSIPSVFGLLRPGFFETDDGGWMLIRFAAFYNSFIDFQLPVRMLEGLNYGYGYPVSNFLYPGFLYFASPLHFIGFGLVNSIKAILAISFIGSGIATFLWLKRILNTQGAILGALIYVYAPYHLFDLYVRGSVGEVVALLFPPLILYCIERRNMVLTALVVFLLILSHNTLAIFFTPIIIVYILLRGNNIKELLFAFFYGVVMSSFFTIPALYELSYTKFSLIKIANPLEYFASLPLIGAYLLGAIGVVLLAAIFIRKSVKALPYGSLFVFFTVVTVAVLFFSLPISTFIWNVIPSSFIQFPFRLLSILLMGAAFLGGYAIFLFKGKTSSVIFLVLLCVLGYSSLSYLLPKNITNLPDEYYATNPATTTVQNEYMPRWVRKNPDKVPANKVEIIKGNGTVENILYNSKKIVFNFKNAEGSVIRVNTLYYPGWVVYINTLRVIPTYDNEYGAIELPITRKNGTVTVAFTETPVRLISNIITALSFCGILLWVLRPYLKFR